MANDPAMMPSALFCTRMWNLDDTTRYQKFVCLDIPKAVTWADMRPGHTDKEKREMIRSVAAATLSQPIPTVQSWAFRIFVRTTTLRHREHPEDYHR
jgi:hypothetical protein